MKILSPSILSADLSNIKTQLDLLKKMSIRNLHVDVMDGAFVPSISFGMPYIKSLRKHTDLVLDVHMMVEEPDRYVEEMCKSGADIITVHAEACKHLDRTVNHIKSFGVAVGVALNPSTPIVMLDEILPFIDMVLVMSVNPGFAGQAFIPYTVQKIARLRHIKKDNKLDFSIQVDGGVNAETLPIVLEAGADNIVAGSAIFNGDIVENINLFKGIMEEVD